MIGDGGWIEASQRGAELEWAALDDIGEIERIEHPPFPTRRSRAHRRGDRLHARGEAPPGLPFPSSLSPPPGCRA
jgi:hypothetical protein